MAQLSNRVSQVVDLTGDDSDVEFDETSISPFHKAMMKQFGARSSPVSKTPRTLLNDQHSSSRPTAAESLSTHVDLTIDGTSTTNGSHSQNVSSTNGTYTVNAPSVSPFQSSKPPLHVNPNGRKEYTNLSSSFTVHQSAPSLQLGINGSSRASSVTATTSLESQKRNAEQAFGPDRRTKTSTLSASIPSLSLSPHKIVKISREKDDKGRAGFGELLSTAEALVTGTQASPLPSTTRNLLVPPVRQSTPSSTAEFLRHSFHQSSLVSLPIEQDTQTSAPKSPVSSHSFSKSFSPPPLQRTSLGSSLRIVPIDDAVSSHQPGLRPDLLPTPPTGFNIMPSEWQLQYAARSPSTEARNLVTLQPSITAVTGYPSQVLPATASATQFGHRAFDSSILPKRQGSPFTDAELILLIYLKEECGISWTDLDRMMGRTTNCCATKYLRKEVGVKYRKPQLKYRERAAFIKVVLKTMPDATILKVWQLLSDFIETGLVPGGCSALYEETLSASSRDQIPSVPRRDNPNSSRKPATEVIFDATTVDTATVRGRLRPGARTGEGAMNVRAMMAREINLESEILSDEASIHTDIAYDSGSDVEYHVLARKDYPHGSSVRRKKPYLGHQERRGLISTLRTVEWEEGENWQGTSLHLDATASELQALTRCAISFLKCNKDAATSLTAAVGNASRSQIKEISRRAQLLPQFRDRTQKSIHAMLLDASTVELSQDPMRLRIAHIQTFPSEKQNSTCILQRELGGAKTALRRIRKTVYDSLTPSKSWTGTSGDVGTLAWSPDGQYFAAGSMCIVDPSSMQYNRQNNLLFGSMQHSTLFELPEHHRPREKSKEGVNASHSMHVSQDPRLFFTVSMVDFSRDGSRMFSVGYDNFLRSYQVGNGRCEQQWAVDYGTEVDLLSTSRHLDLLATGSRDVESGIRIYGALGENEELCRFGSGKAQTFLERKVFPSALRWGMHESVKNYLLAGFAPTSGDETYVTTHGETCLWDVCRNTPVSVTPPAGNIFDVAWSPRSARFATACSAYSHSKNKGTQSVIRICSTVNLDSWSHRGLELECPARDINDVIFSPFDENYVAAGATDSKVYIWDLRRPDNILQCFSHGAPLAELEPGRPQEDTDCGVRFCGWGEHRERLVTGSSDGVVKVWDIHRAPRDAHMRDLATFDTGIMSGAFNHDFSSLLIGEVNGTVNLLEVGVDPTTSLKNLEQFHFEPAAMAMEMKTGSDAAMTKEESGRAIAAEMIKTRKIQRRKWGGFPKRQAVQAKLYDGPYDYTPGSDELREKATVSQKSMMLEILDAKGKVVRDKEGRVIYREQCELPLCTSHLFTTEEEAGDSGRAVDRIPQALRDATTRALEGNETKEGKMVPGMLRCSHCHGLARPRVGDREQEEFPLCERCGFSCFRCGERVKVGLGVEKIGCGGCGLEWCVGALGYEVMSSSSGGGGGRAVRRDKPVGLLDDLELESHAAGLEDMGDLLHLVEDYYHNLWGDKPSSTL
ncbi:gb [Venturia nashicola]|uniref:Gb n=1 Tax=Venturia nashicola TaxID=86259 RepID=A0A4Z1P786_9PEZI|nr:gb [Venturia nashicola]TLD32045.1 gb [Venturia nashicola]